MKSDTPLSNVCQYVVMATCAHFIDSPMVVLPKIQGSSRKIVLVTGARYVLYVFVLHIRRCMQRQHQGFHPTDLRHGFLFEIQWQEPRFPSRLAQSSCCCRRLWDHGAETCQSAILHQEWAGLIPYPRPGLLHILS